MYYAQENPHLTVDKQLNQPGVMVWASISCKGVIGPVFFEDESVNMHSYLNMLEDIVVPKLREEYSGEDFYFQQDGAPPHYAVIVRDFLSNVFPGKWIGRRGPIEWPPRSPDLTPMDFFFWGVVKDKVFEKRPKNVEEMKEFIRRACEEIDEDKELCAKVCLSVETRLQECIDNEGFQFEHLRS